MDTALLMSIIGVAIGLTVTIVAMYKGLKPLVAGPLCAIIICIFCGISYQEGIVGAFSASFASCIKSNLFYYVSSLALSRLMIDSKCANSIAESVSKIIPAKHLPITLFLMCVIMRLGGMGVGAYMLTYAIGIFLCQKANYSENILLGIVVGCCYTVATYAPFFPNPSNALASTLMGTTASAGAVPGMAMTIVSAVLILAYQEWRVRSWQKKGVGFTGEEQINKAAQYRDTGDIEMPPFWKAIIPVVIVVGGYNLFNVHVSFFMFIACFACIALCWKTFKPATWLKLFVTGCYDCLVPLVALASMAAIGGAIKATPLYDWFGTVMASDRINPLVLTTVTGTAFSALLASGSAGIQASGDMLMPMIQASVDAGQYTMGTFHRMLVCGAASPSALPHNGSIGAMMGMFNTTFKKSYMPAFICGFAIPFACTYLIALPLALLGF